MPRFLALSCGARGFSRAHSLYRLSLSVWTAEAVELRTGSVVSSRKFSGETQDGLLSTIEEQASSRGVLRIWTFGAENAAAWGGIFRLVSERGWKLDFACLENPPFILRLSKSGRKIVFCGLENQISEPLDEIASWVGISRVSVDSLVEDFDVRLLACRRDCDLVREVVLRLDRFCRDQGAGRVAETLAQQGFRWWRRSWTGPLPEAHSDEEAANLERYSYYGGRNQLFFQGIVTARTDKGESKPYHKDWKLPWKFGTRIHYLDVRSAYPAIMSRLSVPIRLRRKFQSLSNQAALDFLEEGGLVSSVWIETDTADYPYRVKGRTWFVTGRFRTVLAGSELRNAIESGHVLKVGFSCQYDSAPIFSEWIEKVWPVRRAAIERGDKIESKYVKIAINSLHGKFAQKEEGWIDDPEIGLRRFLGPDGRVDPEMADVCDADGFQIWGHFDRIDTVTGEISKHRVIAGRVQTWGKRPKSRHKLVAVAAYISAECRVALNRIIQAAGPEECLYCDTDSVHVTDQGLERIRNAGLLTGEDLGGLQLRESADFAEYIQRKCYRLGNRWVVAGKPEPAAVLEDLIYLMECWDGSRCLIDRGFSDLIEVRRIRREFKPGYQGGCVLDDGRVVPYCVVEEFPDS